VYYRYARLGNEIYIDLGNKKWDVVRITSEGWEVIPDPPVRFVRHKNMAALPEPSKTPDLGKLRKLINVAFEEDWIPYTCSIDAAARDFSRTCPVGVNSPSLVGRYQWQ
jgi:hypothetical protein